MADSIFQVTKVTRDGVVPRWAVETLSADGAVIFRIVLDREDIAGYIQNNLLSISDDPRAIDDPLRVVHLRVLRLDK